jgi:chemotaxis protein methyltransferase CheR
LSQVARTDTLFPEVLAVVAARSGMVFAANRLVEAEIGIARAMKEARAADLGTYLQLLRRSPPAIDRLVDELTVGETHFMRDPAQMDLLRGTILPALLPRRTAAPIQAWSAGCSTGEEAYSIAILMEQALPGVPASILGTDLSLLALAKARAAAYSSWSMRGVDATFLADYFRTQGPSSVLVDRIRTKVRFHQLNLVGSSSYAVAGAAGMDLVLCRNVLIYFDRETAGRIAARLFASLAEGGVLLTAGADMFLGSFAPFEVEVTQAGLVYRRPRRPRFTGAAPDPAAALPDVAVRPGEDLAPVAAPAPAPPLPRPPDAEELYAAVSGEANEHGAEGAEKAARAASQQFPLDAPLHYLRATLLVTLGRHDEAEIAVSRAIYLDRSLAVAHFLLGTVLGRRGETGAARRAFRNAHELSAAQPAAQALAAGHGERAADLAAAAASEIERLDTVARG